jgi:hypothetical protein
MSNSERTTRNPCLCEQGQETDLRDTTVEQRLLMMSPLALDAWAMLGDDGESRLDHNAACVIRRGQPGHENGQVIGILRKAS